LGGGFFMDLIEWGYLGLFVGSFLAATIIPFSSELILTTLLFNGNNPISCLIIASLGNSFGGLTNYFIGRLGNPKWLLKLGMTVTKLNRFQSTTSKYGHWLAFFAWVPIIGDPLSIALGYFRARLIPFVLLMSLGKTMRYAVVIYLFYQL